jgi:signal transduction histidine kinase
MKYQKEIRMAAIFLGLIMIPSGLLGYLSWRALETERKLSHERLRESYRQFASLASREIDEGLEQIEENWLSLINEIVQNRSPQINLENLENLCSQTPLIAACFFMAAPGKVGYPPNLTVREFEEYSERGDSENYVREYEIFNELANRGEELEYRAYDLDDAIAAYRQILTQVERTQFHAIAESYIGRALMKKGDWEQALSTFQNLLAAYPEVRDLNKMYLRFLAQYQIAVCLDNLDRDPEALAVLLRLNKDLLERSDTINSLQYSFFFDQIQILAERLLSSPNLPDSDRYNKQFRALADQNKKRLSQKYFLELLDRQLNKMVINRKRYRPKVYYVSDEADEKPFLLGFRPIPDPQGVYTAGLLGVQIDLEQLSQRLFPKILRNLKFSDQVMLAILNQRNDFVIGAAAPAGEPIATQALSEPFNFWQVAVYLTGPSPFSRRWDFRTVLGAWFIVLLLLSIFVGAFLFIRRARHEAYLSQLKSSFVSSVSHELRTPLASINMLAELLEMQLAGESKAPKKELTARAREYLQVIRREGERLTRLIENVLDFSKVERGTKQYNFAYEDPAAVVQRAVQSFRPHAEAQGFSLAVDTNGSLPEVRMDGDAIAQAVLNLLSNAVKYSDREKEIRVRTYQQNSSIAIEVSDRGIGIAETEIPKIFEEFYRVDQRLNSQKQGGMGLGLTLVRHIVSAHGGEIKVRSQVGQGSTFTILLPRSVESTIIEK